MSISTVTAPAKRIERDSRLLSKQIETHFASLKGPIFETDASTSQIWTSYLGGFSSTDAQFHDCKCCRRFVEKYGGLAVVGDDGLLTPAIWDEETASDHFRASVAASARIVKRSKPTMPFLSEESTYGTPNAGGFPHIAVHPPANRVFRTLALNNAFQTASLKREEYHSVKQALIDFGSDVCASALSVLEHGNFANAQAVVSQANFLVGLHKTRDSVQGDERKDNLVFRAVAAAPSGFCHPRSSMIGTLLSDLAEGKTFEEAKAAWNAKMDPSQYQRAQAAPTAGAIKAAEEAVAKLGATSALKRRFAKLEDIGETVWLPRVESALSAPSQTSGGIFASVIPKPKGKESTAVAKVNVQIPETTMTWVKFAQMVLPKALNIELLVPTSGSFCALTTQVHDDARPILQWDSQERRNPVALYIYTNGSPASQWGLAAGSFSKVTAITTRPSQWFGDKFAHQSKGIVIVLDGARDSGKLNLALFPSTLRDEFHGMRSVIEAYSQAEKLQGVEDASACGVLLSQDTTFIPQSLRVTIQGQENPLTYKLDRYD